LPHDKAMFTHVAAAVGEWVSVRFEEDVPILVDGFAAVGQEFADCLTAAAAFDAVGAPSSADGS